MSDIDYDTHRYGYAKFGSSETAQEAGLHNAETGLFLGFDDKRLICRSSQQAAVLLMGGARSGKGNHIIPWLVDGSMDSHVISMDWKGQNGAISQLQHNPSARVINWAPRGTSFPSHKINPLSYLRADSETLVADAKLFTQSWIPFTGSKDGEFFQANAQRYLEAITVFYAEAFSEVDLPGLSDIAVIFGTDVDLWVKFETSMRTKSKYQFIRAIGEELATLRKSDNPTAGGMAGIKGEILKQFSCMSDPQLREVLSPPFDFGFAELVETNAPRTQVNFMESMEFSQSSGPVVKAMYTSALIYKRRTRHSRDQVWLLDEIGNIGSWPLALELGTYGPGYGIRPIYCVQSTQQLDNLAPRAASIIPNSCGTQIYKGVRDYNEAQRLSNMLGTMTLQVTDVLRDMELNEEVADLSAKIGSGDEDALTVMQTLEYVKTKLGTKTPLMRSLLTASEILNLHEHDCIVFMPGKLRAPMLLKAPPYWTRADLVGRYLGDPFHDKDGTVSIANGKGGSRTARVVTEDVPPKRKTLPQYREGRWSFVAGYRP